MTFPAKVFFFLQMIYFISQSQLLSPLLLLLFSNLEFKKILLLMSNAFNRFFGDSINTIKKFLWQKIYNILRFYGEKTRV